MNIAVCSPYRADAERISCLFGAMLKRYAIADTDLQIFRYDGLEEFFDAGTDCAAFFLRVDGFSGEEIAAAGTLKGKKAAPVLCLLADTADYCMAGYDMGAEGYLLTPISEEKFHTFFARHLLTMLREFQTLEICSNRVPYRIPVRQIRYIESVGRKCRIHMGKQTVTTNQSLTAIEERLDGSGFLRCHRSYLVNLYYVQDILDYALLLDQGAEVPLTLRKHTQIVRAWNQYLLSPLAGDREE